MDKKTKNKLIIGGLLSGAALLILNQSAKASALNTAPPAPAPSVPSNPVTPVVSYPAGFPIVYNKYNANAKRLQAAMTGIAADGIIGPNTLARWKQFNPQINSGFVIANETQLQQAIAQINSKYTTLPTFPAYDIKIFSASNGAGEGSDIVNVAGVKRSLL